MGFLRFISRNRNLNRVQAIFEREIDRARQAVRALTNRVDSLEVGSRDVGEGLTRRVEFEDYRPILRATQTRLKGLLNRLKQSSLSSTTSAFSRQIGMIRRLLELDPETGVGEFLELLGISDIDLSSYNQDLIFAYGNLKFYDLIYQQTREKPSFLNIVDNSNDLSGLTPIYSNSNNEDSNKVLDMNLSNYKTHIWMTDVYTTPDGGTTSPPLLSGDFLNPLGNDASTWQIRRVTGPTGDRVGIDLFAYTGVLSQTHPVNSVNTQISAVGNKVISGFSSSDRTLPINRGLFLLEKEYALRTNSLRLPGGGSVSLSSNDIQRIRDGSFRYNQASSLDLFKRIKIDFSYRWSGTAWWSILNLTKTADSFNQKTGLIANRFIPEGDPDGVTFYRRQATPQSSGRNLGIVSNSSRGSYIDLIGSNLSSSISLTGIPSRQGNYEAGIFYNLSNLGLEAARRQGIALPDNRSPLTLTQTQVLNTGYRLLAPLPLDLSTTSVEYIYITDMRLEVFINSISLFSLESDFSGNEYLPGASITRGIPSEKNNIISKIDGLLSR